MNILDDIILKCVDDNKNVFIQTCKKYYDMFNNEDNLCFKVNNRIVFEQEGFIKRLLKCKSVRIIGTCNNTFVNWITVKLLSILISDGWKGLKSLSIILQPDRDGNEEIWKDFNVSSLMNNKHLKELDLSGFRNIGLFEIGDLFNCNLSLQKLKLDSRNDMYLSNNLTYSIYYDSILAPMLWLPINKAINISSLKYLDISNRFLALSCNFDDIILNISSLCNLTHLDISNNYVTNENMSSIKDMLSSCKTLTSLDLRINIISNIDELKDNLSQIKMLGLSQSKKDVIDIKNVWNYMQDIDTLYIGETNCIMKLLSIPVIRRIEFDIDILFLVKFQHFSISNHVLKQLEYIHLNIDMWILNYDVFILFEVFLNFIANLQSLNEIILCCDTYGSILREKIETILKNKNVKFLNKNPNNELIQFNDVILSNDNDKICDENN